MTFSRRIVSTLILAAAAWTPMHAAAADVDYRTEKIDGLDVFYREAGPKDAPAVLLLHGFPTSSHMFRDLIPKLAENYHVVAPDYPGFGYSSAPPVDEFDYTFDRLAEIVGKFTEKIGLTRYSIYLMDYGAPVGFRLAAAHPERVDSLIVQNGNAYDEGIDNDFWKPIKKYWKDRTKENGDALRGLLTLGCDEMAIRPRRPRNNKDQPRRMGPCAAAARSARQSGNPTRALFQLRKQSAALP